MVNVLWRLILEPGKDSQLVLQGSYPNLSLSYEVMHSCWSPVPKCRPSFQQLVVQLETLHLGLSPTCPPSLYVNLEGDEDPDGGAAGPQELAHSLELSSSAETSSWSVPWQRRADEEERDRLVGGSGAARDIGGDYRYIIRHCGAAEEENRLQEQAEDDDAVINV